MKPIVYSLFGHNTLALHIQEYLHADLGQVHSRHFPDGETYLRIDEDVKNRQVVVVASLDNPDSKLSTLMFLAQTLKQEGASQIGLVAPYLCYMRQDKQFNKGEAVTSRYFAQFISHHYNWLITVDPHLHRYKSMDEIYTIETTVIHAAPTIAGWIQQHIEHPFIIGPDSESKQWVSEVASGAKAPYAVLSKERLGDHEVKITLPKTLALAKSQPILMDDIISTGHTMMEALKLLKSMTTTAPICVGVHGLFAQNAYQELLNHGASRVITCNTLAHPSNEIDLLQPICSALSKYIQT